MNRSEFSIARISARLASESLRTFLRRRFGRTGAGR